jgi:hypothetical protein
MVRCDWCRVEVKSVDAIYVGDDKFCSDYCKRMHLTPEPSQQALPDSARATGG